MIAEFHSEGTFFRIRSTSDTISTMHELCHRISVLHIVFDPYLLFYYVTYNKISVVL